MRANGQDFFQILDFQGSKGKESITCLAHKAKAEVFHDFPRYFSSNIWYVHHLISTNSGETFQFRSYVIARVAQLLRQRTLGYDVSSLGTSISISAYAVK